MRRIITLSTGSTVENISYDGMSMVSSLLFVAFSVAYFSSGPLTPVITINSDGLTRSPNIAWVYSDPNPGILTGLTTRLTYYNQLMEQNIPTGITVTYLINVFLRRADSPNDDFYVQPIYTTATITGDTNAESITSNSSSTNDENCIPLSIGDRIFLSISVQHVSGTSPSSLTLPTQLSASLLIQ